MKCCFLILSIILFATCTNKEEDATDIKFLVNEYKIINDTATSHNSRFASLSKEGDRYKWAKLFRVDSYNSFGLVDSFYIIDSIEIEYSLDEDHIIDKIHNWPTLKSWSKNAIAEVFSQYDKPLPPEVENLLAMGTDSSMFITKNIVELNAYNYFYLLHKEYIGKQFARTEDKNFYYYNTDVEVDEVGRSKTTNFLSSIKDQDWEIDGMKNAVEIITDKESGEFVMGTMDQIVIFGSDTAVRRIRVIKLDDFRLDVINQFGD